MVKSEKRRFGDLGEKIAQTFLEKKGYYLVEKNYWKPFGEIDLIMKRDNQIYFFEVKTGKINGFVDPKNQLTDFKLEKFERICEFYLDNKKVREKINSFGTKEKIKYHFRAILVYLDLENKKSKVKIINNFN